MATERIKCVVCGEDLIRDKGSHKITHGGWCADKWKMLDRRQKEELRNPNERKENEKV